MLFFFFLSSFLLSNENEGGWHDCEGEDRRGRRSTVENGGGQRDCEGEDR